jgi:arabinan endo-1,5-alpha-L-arabinosidase
MKLYLSALVFACLLLPAFALDGQIGIHDPSTVILCDGKYYAFGTGGGGLISDDGWTWRGGAARPGGGVAPDVVRIGDRYLVTYAGSGVHTMWTKTLDPNSPDFGFTDDTVVATSDGTECNAIDSSLLLDPTDGKLWMTYGSYVGYIRLIELDPKTGKRVNPDERPLDIAINCEASQLIYHDGWYYLLGNKGSCCAGSDSGYNIRVGRSKKVTGPFLDNMGIDMIQGGGKLFVTSSGRYVGPGHFGLLDLGDGVQKWSCHYEADLDRGGASVLDIRPLLWNDGWPEAGDNMKGGNYNIESQRTGTSLELAVDKAPVGGGRARGGGGRGAAAGTGGAAPGGALGGGGAGPGAGGRGLFGGTGRGPIPEQDVVQVSANWPAANIDVRLGNYMCQAAQKWTLAPAPNAGGYPGSPYFKITLAGTDRALAATAAGELVALPAFTGGPEQLWRIDQLADGTYRIMPKGVPNSNEPLVLSAVGSSSATLAKFNPKSDKQRWNLKTP